MLILIALLIFLSFLRRTEGIRCAADRGQECCGDVCVYTVQADYRGGKELKNQGCASGPIFERLLTKPSRSKAKCLNELAGEQRCFCSGDMCNSAEALGTLALQSWNARTCQKNDPTLCSECVCSGFAGSGGITDACLTSYCHFQRSRLFDLITDSCYRIDDDARPLDTCRCSTGDYCASQMFPAQNFNSKKVECYKGLIAATTNNTCWGDVCFIQSFAGGFSNRGCLSYNQTLQPGLFTTSYHGMNFDFRNDNGSIGHRGEEYFMCETALCNDELGNVIQKLQAAGVNIPDPFCASSNSSSMADPHSIPAPTVHLPIAWEDNGGGATSNDYITMGDYYTEMTSEPPTLPSTEGTEAWSTEYHTDPHHVTEATIKGSSIAAASSTTTHSAGTASGSSVSPSSAPTATASAATTQSSASSGMPASGIPSSMPSTHSSANSGATASAMPAGNATAVMPSITGGASQSNTAPSENSTAPTTWSSATGGITVQSTVMTTGSRGTASGVSATGASSAPVTAQSTVITPGSSAPQGTASSGSSPSTTPTASSSVATTPTPLPADVRGRWGNLVSSVKEFMERQNGQGPEWLGHMVS